MSSFINPAPERSIPVEAKLPSNLRPVYREIKQKIDIIVRWLVENGSVGRDAATKSPGERTYGTTNLTAFAENVVARGVTVPGRILQALAFSIDARSEVSRWYKAFLKVPNYKQKKSNRKHGHFILILRRILDSFQGDTELLAPPATATTGKFHILLGLADEESNHLAPNSSSTPSGQESAPEPEVEESEDELYVVQDGGMAEKLELVLAILASALDLDVALADIKAYWTEAAKGPISFLLAAYLTNFHVSLAKEEFSQSLAKLRISSNEGLLKSYQLAQEPSTLIKADAVFATGFGFQNPPKALRLALAMEASKLARFDELAKVGITYDKGDSHMKELVELVSDLKEATAQGSDQPGAESLLKWLKDNESQNNFTAIKSDDPLLKAGDFISLGHLLTAYLWNR
ncbi:hypothetical protein MMC30_001844 [Trapelia coarctata]|nr:hypothetical protein [Trapelia coarctata]